MKILPINITNTSQAAQLMRDYGVTPQGIAILENKTRFHAFTLEGISSWEANIIKQHLLSLGADSAISRNALVTKCKTNTIIFGTRNQLNNLCVKLKTQPFNLARIADILTDQLRFADQNSYTISARDRKVSVTSPLVCGIINVTPDSFSGDGILGKTGSSSEAVSLAVRLAGQMIKDGAKIVDIGGQSSRPFAKRIAANEERGRVIPVVKAIRKHFPRVLISIDTFYFSVARAAIDAGADIVNDITALRYDKRMAGLIARTKAACILMHMQGMPDTMQKKPRYNNVINELTDFFTDRIDFCLNKKIALTQIIIDPGIGFGKRVIDNTKLLKNIYKFKIFGVPIFLGLSNKSFIGKIVDADLSTRAAGTLSANILAILGGVKILRVHDVKQTIDALKIADVIWKS